MDKNRKTLLYWQEKYREAEAAIKTDREKMRLREALYDGHAVIYDEHWQEMKTPYPVHVRNVCKEIIETQVDSTIPAPKVTALRREDEHLARIIESMLRDTLDRLPMERINDEQERTCPIQGGVGLLLSWDERKGGCEHIGEVTVEGLHPREIVTQPGIYEVEEMDYLFLREGRTRRYLERRYHVELAHENEEDPYARSLDGETVSDGEVLTLISAYYRNAQGGIGLVRWVNDTLLEQQEDFQKRRVHVCRQCGAPGDGVQCRYCGGKRFTCEVREYEELQEDIETKNGTVIRAQRPKRDEQGEAVFAPAAREEDAQGAQDDFTRDAAQEVTQEGGNALRNLLLPQLTPPQTLPTDLLGAPAVHESVWEATRIPYYRPDMYPIIVRKNVSRAGQFWGDSDIDTIAQQQNAMNKISTKMQRKILASGSFVTIPRAAGNFVSDDDMQVLRVDEPKTLNMIHTFSTAADIGGDMQLRHELYEEARQVIGITDSMQGRRDPTATSAVAKQFAAQQASGRMESRRVMKQAMYQELFERIFKLMLAYCETPRRVRSRTEDGEDTFLEFNRYDFLYEDASGNLRWNTDFLFSCDATATLYRDRAAMWQEARMSFADGTMGDHNDKRTLLRFWRQMEHLHYPMAGEMKKALELELEEEKAQESEQATRAMQTMQALQGTQQGARGMQGTQGAFDGDGV